MAFAHASMVLGEIPVTDIWARTVENYGDVAKVVILGDSLPRDIATSDADLARGGTRPGLAAVAGDAAGGPPARGHPRRSGHLLPPAPISWHATAPSI